MGGITIKEFEDEFHELWSDPEDEQAAEDTLYEEEASIEQHNADYESGKSSFSEKLNELSAMTKDEIELEKEGLVEMDATDYATGLIETPEQERHMSPEDEAYLNAIYEELDRWGIPSSFDARKKGINFLT